VRGRIHTCFAVILFVCILAPSTLYAWTYLHLFGDSACSDSSGHILPYRFFVPPDYDANKKYAVIVFFHGAGERGADNERQFRDAETLYSANTAYRDECFMIVPQCPGTHTFSGIDWGSLPYTMRADQTWPSRLTFEVLAKTQEQYSIDPARIYSVGVSMGSQGMWDMAIRHPDVFAAGVSMCGGFDTTKVSFIKNIPFQIFHGSSDPWVPVQGSRDMADAFEKAGVSVKRSNVAGDPDSAFVKNAGTGVAYTEYEGANHYIWDRTLTNSTLYDWLFARSKGANTARLRPAVMHASLSIFHHAFVRMIPATCACSGDGVNAKGRLVAQKDSPLSQWNCIIRAYR
jgi:predicted peptidase